MRRKKSKLWKKETELAALVVEWLEADGWEVWQECAGIDIVAKKDGVVWAIEAKLTENIKVMQQAYDAQRHAHCVSVAVPAMGYGRHKDFFETICRHLGVGVIRVRHPSYCRSAKLCARVEVEAPQRERKVLALDTHLNENAKAYPAEAGSPGGGGWTPFKQTVIDLVAYVRKHGEPTVKEAVAGITHHYSSDRAAARNLARYVGTVIPELTMYFDKESKAHRLKAEPLGLKARMRAGARG